VCVLLGWGVGMGKKILPLYTIIVHFILLTFTSITNKLFFLVFMVVVQFQRFGRVPG